MLIKKWYVGKLGLDWPDEQTVGIGFQLFHVAATPPGHTVTIRVELVQLVGRKLTFQVAALDEHDLISSGSHERFVIDAARFRAKAAAKAAARRHECQKR